MKQSTINLLNGSYNGRHETMSCGYINNNQNRGQIQWKLDFGLDFQVICFAYWQKRNALSSEQGLRKVTFEVPR
jgi:hypothetical protein